jgi:cytochrome c-type biogenesis protein CcmE
MTTTAPDARQRDARTTRRRRAIIAMSLCAAAAVAIVVLAVVLSANVVYFRTVSEAVARRHEDGSARFRIAGQVVPNSVVETHDGVRFEISDGKKTVEVVHRGDPPDLFKEDSPVVCEGHWGRGDTTFESDRILIRHGNDYEPPKVDVRSGTTGGRRSTMRGTASA